MSNQNFPFNTKTCIKISQINASLLLNSRPGLNRKQNGSLLQQNGSWLFTENISWKGQTLPRYHALQFIYKSVQKHSTKVNQTSPDYSWWWMGGLREKGGTKKGNVQIPYLLKHTIQKWNVATNWRVHSIKQSPLNTTVAQLAMKFFSFIDSEALYHVKIIQPPDHMYPGHTLTFFPYDSF